VRILPDDTSARLRAEGIHYVVVKDDYLGQTHQTIDQWLAHYDGTLVKKWGFFVGAGQPLQHFFLVQLQDQK
jgi:hypothetical protein